MSLINVIKRYFSKRAETSDSHWDPTLQTHYYKTTKEEGFEEIKNFFQHNDNYNVKFISKEYGEIGVYHNKLFLVVTIVMVHPFQTAIDFTVTSESVFPIGFGSSSKCIQNLYEQFDKLLPLIK